MKSLVQCLVAGMFVLFSPAVLCAQYNPQKTEELKNLLYEISALGQGLGMIKNLVEEKADPNAVCTHQHITALYIAASVGDESLIDFLLEQGADLKIPDCSYVTPLKIAANYGHGNVVKKLLKWGANINEADSSGNTALTFAAYQGHADLVTLFLRSGATINIPSRGSRSKFPFIRGSFDDNEEVIRILLEYGAHLTDPIFYLASSSKQIFITAFLYYNGPDLPFHNALRSKRSKRINKLRAVLEQNSNTFIELAINKPNDIGLTPFDIAMINRDEEAILLLLAHGANPSTGLINGLRLASRVKEWQTPRPSDIKKRSLYTQIYHVVSNDYLIELFLSAPNMPEEIILLIVDWMFVPWTIKD